MRKIFAAIAAALMISVGTAVSIQQKDFLGNDNKQVDERRPRHKDGEDRRPHPKDD